MHKNVRYIHNMSTDPIQAINQSITPLFSLAVEHSTVLTDRTRGTTVELKSAQQEIGEETVAVVAGLVAEKQQPQYYAEIGTYWLSAENEMEERMLYYVA